MTMNELLDMNYEKKRLNDSEPPRFMALLRFLQCKYIHFFCK